MKHFLTAILFFITLSALPQAGLMIGGASSSAKTSEDAQESAIVPDTTFVLNEGFDDWSGGANPNAFPATWILSGNGVDEFWDETNSSGGAGTGHALLSTTSANVNISQNSLLTANTWYGVILVITGGSDIDLQVQILGGTTSQDFNFSTIGTHSFYFYSDDNDDFQLKRVAGSANTVIDFVKVWNAEAFWHTDFEILASNANTNSAPFDYADANASNAWIQKLDDDGDWAEIDVMWVGEADDVIQARLNWKDATYDLTDISTPGFTADQGYSGAAASAYNTNWIPDEDGVNFAQDDNSIHYYSNDGSQSSANSAAYGWGDGTTIVQLVRNPAGNILNTNFNPSSSPVTGANTDTDGLFSNVRTSSTNHEVFIDNVSFGTQANPSNASFGNSRPMYLAAYNAGGSLIYPFNQGEISFVIIGSSSISIANIEAGYNTYSTNRD